MMLQGIKGGGGWCLSQRKTTKKKNNVRKRGPKKDPGTHGEDTPKKKGWLNKEQHNKRGFFDRTTYNPQKGKEKILGTWPRDL